MIYDSVRVSEIKFGFSCDTGPCNISTTSNQLLWKYLIFILFNIDRVLQWIVFYCYKKLIVNSCWHPSYTYDTNTRPAIYRTEIIHNSQWPKYIELGVGFDV